MNHWKSPILAITLMLSSLLLDGFLSSVWTTQLNTSIGFMVPRTVILVLIILSFHYDKGFLMGLSVIFGFIMDTYYLGFIGVYMASFLLIAYVTFHLKSILRANVLSYGLASILGITLVEFVVYGIMNILGVTSMPFQLFIVSRFTATLLFNTIIMLLFSYFIHLSILRVNDEA